MHYFTKPNTLNSNQNNINYLVDLISKIKEKEIKTYEKKMFFLERSMQKYPNEKVYNYRYELAKARFESLIQTTTRLKHLELNVKKIKKFQEF